MVRDFTLGILVMFSHDEHVTRTILSAQHNTIPEKNLDGATDVVLHLVRHYRILSNDDRCVRGGRLTRGRMTSEPAKAKLKGGGRSDCPKIPA